MFLVNSRLGLVSATLTATPSTCGFTARAPLIPKLRGHFAEFLHHDSPDRLGILYLSTSVGLGYGRLTTRSRSFSRQHRITHTTTQRQQCHQLSTTRCADLPTHRPTILAHDNHRVGWATFLRPSAACLLPAQVTDSTTHDPRRDRQAISHAQYHQPRQDRCFTGTRISTGCPSTTPVGLALGPDSPRAD